MRIRTHAAVACIGLVAAVAALPGRADVGRSASIAAEPRAVHATIPSRAGFDRINPFRDADPDLTVIFFGPEGGPGAGLARSGRSGSGSQTIVAADPDRQATMRLDLRATGRPTQRSTLSPAHDGARVAWTLEAETGGNPLRRIVGLVMDRLLGAASDRGLLKLASAAAGV